MEHIKPSPLAFLKGLVKMKIKIECVCIKNKVLNKKKQEGQTPHARDCFNHGGVFILTLWLDSCTYYFSALRVQHDGIKNLYVCFQIESNDLFVYNKVWKKCLDSVL